MKVDDSEGWYVDRYFVFEIDRSIDVGIYIYIDDDIYSDVDYVVGMGDE